MRSSFEESRVALDLYDSDLHLDIDNEDTCSARAVSTEGFGYLWAGARATHGANKGKVMV